MSKKRRNKTNNKNSNDSQNNSINDSQNNIGNNPDSESDKSITYDRNNDTLNNIININKEFPLVSICTPTFNRRPFIEYMIKCFMHQDYPKEKMEWIIIDDGTDKIKDLIINIKGVKYFKYDKKMSLGKKRNIMHSKTQGDIIVYMDDDDYYPPERVSHSVEMLLKHPNALCAGSSEIYVYFKHIQKLYQFGPYSPNHATAGTFAFKKELLINHSYEDDAALAEEKHFLKNYTVPFVQLDPIKTILVCSHSHNTYDKKHLLIDNENKGNNNFCKESDKSIDLFIKDQDMKDFYLNKIENLLKSYEPGKSFMKPDVLQQMLDIERERRRVLEKHLVNKSEISISTSDGKQQTLNMDQIVLLLRQNQEQIKMLIKEKTELINNIQNNTNTNNFINMEQKDNKNYKIKYNKIKRENKRLHKVLLKELEKKNDDLNKDYSSVSESESD